MIKTEVPGLCKTSNGAIVNVDSVALEAYKKKKQQNNKIAEIETKVDVLSSDIAEIKDFLKLLISKTK